MMPNTDKYFDEELNEEKVKKIISKYSWSAKHTGRQSEAVGVTLTKETDI